ncbi:hypothetical protein L5G28_16390 [Gordonia sp. HY285]|uniref:hypothetical protein n=1 Tax=Gordonia liuliyuniae TaxID=2911517 RepID=UPI001F388400|nr:hypothetical protein [Gordonia liuliyuniae]MCF8611726.1 hypothetical protein [Gordonia liuliyuniae]
MQSINFDNIVSDLARFGVKVSDAVKVHADSADAIRWSYDSKPNVPTDPVTEDTAEAYVHQYARELMLATAVDGLSPLERAKRELVDAHQRLAMAEIRKDSANIFETLSLIVDDAGEKLVEAVKQLPKKLDAESLVAAGASAVAAMSVAREAGAKLKSVEAFVTLHGQAVGLSTPSDRPLRLFRPVNAVEYANIENAFLATNSTQFENQIGYAFFVAAKAGIEIGLNDTKKAGWIQSQLSSSVMM